MAGTLDPPAGAAKGPLAPAGAAVGGPRGLVLASCCGALVLAGLDSALVTAALPAIGRALGGGTAGLQWVVAAYTVPVAALLAGAGTLADRIGRRAVLLAALAVFAGGAWGCSLAPSLGWLAAARAVQGCGAAGLAPAALGIITSVYPRGRERARAIGAWNASLGAGMAAGLTAGGVLVRAAGWRAAFWASVPAALAVLVAVALLAPEARTPSWRPACPAGQVLALAALGGLAGGIIEGPALGWGSLPVDAAFGIAAAAGAGLAAVSRRRPRPLAGAGMLRPGPAAAGLAGGLLATAASAGWLFLITLYLQDARGLEAMRAGLVILPLPLMMTAGSAAAGRAAGRYGPCPLFAAGGAGITAACVMLYGLTSSTSLAVPAGACAVFGAGLGLASTAVTHSVMGTVGEGAAGLASGMNSAARQLGATIGVAAAGAALAPGGGGPAAGFGHGSAGAWWVLSACGAGVAVLGMAGLPGGGGGHVHR